MNSDLPEEVNPEELNPQEDDQPSTPHLKSDEEYIHERLTEEELKDPEKLAQLERQKQECPIKPPDTDELEEARETR